MCIGMKYVLPKNYTSIQFADSARNSLAYCELYVVLGNMFRRFDNLKGNELKPEDRVINDYISARLPLTATRFHVSAGPKVG